MANLDMSGTGPLYKRLFLLKGRGFNSRYYCHYTLAWMDQEKDVLLWSPHLHIFYTFVLHVRSAGVESAETGGHWIKSYLSN